MKKVESPFDYVSNDTLILTLWTLRQDEWTEHSPDVQQRYELVLNEVIARKNNGLLSAWNYWLAIIDNHLGHLTNVDNGFLNALITPILVKS